MIYWIYKTHWSNISRPCDLVVMVAAAYIGIQCKRLCVKSLADAFCGTFPESLWTPPGLHPVTL